MYNFIHIFHSFFYIRTMRKLIKENNFSYLRFVNWKSSMIVNMKINIFSIELISRTFQLVISFSHIPEKKFISLSMNSNILLYMYYRFENILLPALSSVLVSPFCIHIGEWYLFLYLTCHIIFRPMLILITLTILMYVQQNLQIFKECWKNKSIDWVHIFP